MPGELVETLVNRVAFRAKAGLLGCMSYLADVIVEQPQVLSEEHRSKLVVSLEAWNEATIVSPEGRGEFARAERLDPRNVTIMLEHAFLYDSRRQFPEAVRKCEQILNIIPDNPDALLEEANVAMAEGDLARAGSLLARLTWSSAWSLQV